MARERESIYRPNIDIEGQFLVEVWLRGLGETLASHSVTTESLPPS
jgi:hypothetical protein